MRRALAALAALLLLAAPAMALYSKKDGVLLLNGRTFDKIIMNSTGVAIVEFFAPWCGHCKALAPHYVKVAANLKGIATVAAVDCDDAGNRQLCGRFGVQGFPTLKLFGSDRQKNPYTGEYSKEAMDYNGPRTAKAIASAVTDLLTDLHITRLASPADHADFLAKQPAGRPLALLFTKQRGSSVLYKGLSTQLTGRMAFAEIHDSAADLAAQYGITQWPTLFVRPTAEAEPVAYTGELKALPLRDFLTSHLPDAGEPASSSDGSRKGGAGKGAGEDEEPEAAIPTATLEDLVAFDEQEDMRLLAFHFAPPTATAAGSGRCAAELKQLTAALRPLATLVNSSVVNLAATGSGAGEEKQAEAPSRSEPGCGTTAPPKGAADTGMCTAPPEAAPAASSVYDGAFASSAASGEGPGGEGSAATAAAALSPAAAAAVQRYGLDAAALAALAAQPCAFQLVLLPFGSDKADLEDYAVYEGPLEAKALQAFVLERVPDFTMTLTPEMAEPFLASGALNGAFDPRVILVTNKDEAPGVFKALAMNMRHASKYQFGWLRHDDASRPVFREMKVHRIPSILVALPRPATEEQKQAGQSGIAMSFQPYTGPIKYSSIYEWLRMMAVVTGTWRGPLSPEMAAFQQEAQQAAGASPVVELTDDAAFQSHCASQGGLCVLAALRKPSEGAESRGEPFEVEALKSVAAKRSSDPLRFAWLDADAFGGFLATFGARNRAGQPTAIVLSPKKLRFAVLSAPLTVGNLDSFISDVLGGRVATSPLDSLPPLSAGGAAAGAGGSAGDSGSSSGTDEEVAVEEEFDLSDIMAEDISGGEALESKEQKLRKAIEEEEASRKAAAEAKAAGAKKKSKKKRAKKAAKKTEL